MRPYPDQSVRTRFANAAGYIHPSTAFIILIFGALLAFEVFNYSTTDHALTDILGDLSFAGIRWSTILALAFCGIDFAGIARLFTPEQGMNEPREVWYLFAAWLMAATMNAVLTWWGVSMAVSSHALSSTVVDPQMMDRVVPVFIAVLVWLIRILIIGTLSISLERYLSPQIPLSMASPVQHSLRQQPARSQVSPAARQADSTAPQPRASLGHFEDPNEEPAQPARSIRTEPSYHTLSMSARPKNRRM